MTVAVSGQYNYNNNDQSNNNGYQYNINNPQPYNYQREQVYNVGLTRSPEENEALVDTIIARTEDTSKTIKDSINAITDNELIAKLLADNNNIPCGLRPEEMTAPIDRVAGEIANAKPEFTAFLSALNGVQAGGANSASQSINALAEAVGMLEPIMAKFNGVFDFSSACNSGSSSSEDAVSVAAARYTNLGDKLDTMSKTSYVTKNDPQTKSAMTKASKASKAIGRVASNLEQKSKDCESSPTFTRDLLTGMSDLMEGVTEIFEEFNTPATQVNQIREASEIIKEGTDLLEDLDLQSVTRALLPSQGCAVNIASVSAALKEIADVADVLQDSNLGSLGRSASTYNAAGTNYKFNYNYRYPGGSY